MDDLGSRSRGADVAVTLRVEGFAFPLLPDRFDGCLLVCSEVRPADPEPEVWTLRFELDGVGIAARDEKLRILAMMISSVSHPVIHSFNNRLYESHDDPRPGAPTTLLPRAQASPIAWFSRYCFIRRPGAHLVSGAPASPRS